MKFNQERYKMKKYIYELNKNELKQYKKIALDKSYGIITQSEFNNKLKSILK